MRIAVLLYGQPRFWDLSYESIIQETTFEGCTTDYYFHFWETISYGSNDIEKEITDEVKEKIVNIYKPKKYEFTNYDSLIEDAEKVYMHVDIAREDVKNLNLQKSIFETCRPEHLLNYIGQFTSLKRVANLVEQKYDYIFRIRTDLIFATSELYDTKRDYYYDKRYYYDKMLNGQKGIFCKYGDLQIWEGAEDKSGHNTDHQPKSRKIYESVTYVNNNFYSKRRNLGISDRYRAATQYLHIKDWCILGSATEMLKWMKSYIQTIIDMVYKSQQLLIKNNIDVNWAAGELVCGESLIKEKLNATELGYQYYQNMIVPDRYLKIANKHTKQCILDRPSIRVLADTKESLLYQYKQNIKNEQR